MWWKVTKFFRFAYLKKSETNSHESNLISSPFSVIYFVDAAAVPPSGDDSFFFFFTFSFFFAPERVSDLHIVLGYLWPWRAAYKYLFSVDWFKAPRCQRWNLFILSRDLRVCFDVWSNFLVWWKEKSKVVAQWRSPFAIYCGW